jgi:HlyD family secretion protein
VDVVLIQGGQNAKLEVDAFKDRKFNGEVTEIANSSKALGLGGSVGGTSQDATKFEVKIRIKDKAVFRPGMSVTADVETRWHTNVLAVPIASVTTRLPKPPDDGKRSGRKGTNQVSRPASATSGGAALAANHPPGGTNTAGTNVAGTNAVSSTATGTNTIAAAAGKKPGEKPRPIEVVFIKVSERAKMTPVKLGISDDSYTEITEGVTEGQEVVSGGFKAISRELEDDKKVRIGKPPAEEKDKGKEQEKK